MDSIEITNFKGYHNHVEVPLGGKNLLLFGENGAGKSSMYEALRHFFFGDRIESELVPASATPEDRAQRLNDYYDKLRFAGETTPYSIKVNGQDRSSFSRNNYKVFFVSPAELRTEGELKLSSLIPHLYFDGKPLEVLDTLWKQLLDETNKVLKESFREAISISIEKSDNYRVSIKDENNGRIYGKELDIHYNESRLHLIRFLLLLEIIHILYEEDKHNLIVLDDFVTSLDAANRAFIVRYILSYYKSFQLIVMTHSSGFYDMFRYEANLLQHDSWKSGCVYSSENTCKYYDDKNDENLSVNLSLISDSDPVALRDAGNKIRRNFEILVHRISRKLSIGALEESCGLLERLEHSPVLYRNGDKLSDSIIDQVIALTSNDHYKDTELGKKLTSKLTLYKIDLSFLQQCLTQMDLFKKIALHPSSHATAGIGSASPVHKKELEESARVLNELVAITKTIKVHNEALF